MPDTPTTYRSYPRQLAVSASRLVRPYTSWPALFSADPNAITTFQGRHRFLSNFHPCRFHYNSELYRSSEAAFQAAKTADRDERLKIAAMDPVRAKSYGQHVRLRPDWNSIEDGVHVKVIVMADILSCKFAQNTDLAERLLLTHPVWLYEGNRRGDLYWGVNYRLVGYNWLGRLLLAIRQDLSVIHPDHIVS